MQEQNIKPCIKYLATFALKGGFLMMGIGSSILGPTLLTLTCNLGKNVSDMTFVVLAKGFGYLVGSLITPVFSRRISQYALLAYALFLITFGELISPFMPMTPLLAFAGFLSGFGMGVMEIAGYVLIFQLWKSRSDPVIQASQLIYGIGSAMAPLLANPFIYDESVTSTGENMNNTVINKTTNITECTTSIFLHTTFTSIFTVDLPYVAWTFIILSSVGSFFVIIFIYLSCTQSKLLASRSNEKVVPDNKLFRFLWLFLQFWFFAIHVGTEIGVSTYLYTFLIKSDFKATKDIGTTLNSVWWIAFIFGCLAAVLASKKWTPQRIIGIDMVGLSISVIILALFPTYLHKANEFLWVGIFLYAFFLASIYPTGITWSGHCIMFNASAASVLTVSGGLGDMVVQLAVGLQIERNPNILIWIMAINTAIIVFLYLLLVKLEATKKRFPTKNSATVSQNENTEQKEEVKEGLINGS